MKNIWILFFSLFLLSSCQNGNFFGWLHKEGADKSPEALIADAEAALNEDNPTEAKNYAEEILKTDPDNSEALYIHAQATLEEAGFDLGGIISDAIKSADDSQSTDSLLETFESMDINQVAEAINTAVDNLKKIVESGDGSISPDDVDVNLNLGILEVLDAAFEVVNFDNDELIVGDTDDVIYIDENYTVKIKKKDGTYTENFNDLTQEDIDYLNRLVNDDENTVIQELDNAIEQITEAADHITTAADSAGLLDDSDTSTIEDLKSSIETDLKTQLEDLKTKLEAPQ